MQACDFRVGFASRSDAQAFALMSRDLVEHGLDWNYREERIRRLIVDPDTVAIVARDRRQRAGFAIMNVGEQWAHLVLMAVYPAYQRRGIGERMLAWLIQSAAVAGTAAVHVELRAGNRAAYRLYCKLGFGETTRVAGYYGGRETAVRMVRVLRASGIARLPWRPPAHDPQ